MNSSESTVSKIKLNREQLKVTAFGLWLIEKKPNRAYKILKQSEIVQPLPTERNLRLWFKQFMNKEFSFKDKPRSGRPITVSVATNIERIDQLRKKNRETTIKKLSIESGLKRTSIRNILVLKLRAKKLRPIKLPHKLSDEQMEERVEWCKTMIEKFRNSPETIDDIVTGDETYLFYEQVYHGREWTTEDEDAPRKTIMNKTFTTNKRMFFIFFNRRGLVHLDFQPLNQAAKSNNYEWQLIQVMDECKKQGMERIVIHDDNARIHTCKRIDNFQKSNKLDRLTHPKYSPDLAPNDFWLIGKLKKSMREIKFQDEYEMYRHAYSFLKTIPESEYRNCFDNWIKRMHTCIREGGKYFEFRKRNLKSKKD